MPVEYIVYADCADLPQSKSSSVEVTAVCISRFSNALIKGMISSDSFEAISLCYSRRGSDCGPWPWIMPTQHSC